MPIIDRVDPEVAAILLTLPYSPDLSDIPAARAPYHARFEAMAAVAPDPGVTREDVKVPGPAGEPDVAVRVFRPLAEAEGPLGAMVWIQGGGYVLTNPTMDDAWCEGLVTRHGIVVVSVAWRRAPEHPFPAAVEDAYAALAWLHGNAAALEVDAGRILIGGASSGGGTAAGLALLARDRGELPVAHQLLIYPMLDDRNVTPASHTVTDPPVWNRAKNEAAWRAYLGDAYGTDDVSPYAAPTRATDLTGLPPATILTGDLDLFVDEDVEYAQRLIQAGVPTELHVYTGAPHAFDRVAPGATITRRFMADRDALLERALTSASPVAG